MAADTVRELAVAAREAFARREGPAAALGDAADEVARACRALAARFHDGGKLLAFGNGGPSTDAQHVSVEFVHPVIVGKRALPALSLVADAATVTGVAGRAGVDEVFAHQLRVLGEPADVALGISADGRCRNVLRGLETAHEAGLATVALLGGDGGPVGASPAVDHAVVVPAEDPHVVKEVHVTAYHVLWELVHVFLEQPATLGDRAGDGEPTAPPGGVEGLYPFLYGGATDVAAVLDEVARSTAAKVDEAIALRRRVGERDGDAIAACAGELARCFERGGRLLAFGNGGSSSDAQEVARSFLEPAHEGVRPLPALCLTNDVAVLTALSNDVDFEVVFARQVRAFGRAGDVAVGLSTSGNSPNLLRGLEAAKERGLVTVGIAGGDGGAMATSPAVDHRFVVPSSSVHRIQEVQTTLYHVLRELTAAAMAA